MLMNSFYLLMLLKPISHTCTCPTVSSWHLEFITTRAIPSNNNNNKRNFTRNLSSKNISFFILNIGRHTHTQHGHRVTIGTRRVLFVKLSLLGRRNKTPLFQHNNEIIFDKQTDTFLQTQTQTQTHKVQKFRKEI